MKISLSLSTPSPPPPPHILLSSAAPSRSHTQSFSFSLLFSQLVLGIDGGLGGSLLWVYPFSFLGHGEQQTLAIIPHPDAWAKLPPLAKAFSAHHSLSSFQHVSFFVSSAANLRLLSFVSSFLLVSLFGLAEWVISRRRFIRHAKRLMTALWTMTPHGSWKVNALDDCKLFAYFMRLWKG